MFQGYSIDGQSESMTFLDASEAQLPDPRIPAEGSYFTGRYSPDEVLCGADLLGIVQMLWFSAPGITVVSDSFLTLVSLRKLLNLPTTPNERAIVARFWLNSMAGAQLSEETFCSEIHYCLPGTHIRIDVASCTAVPVLLDYRAFYESAFDSHASAVRYSTIRMVRALKAYATAGGLVSLALSGGIDSRVCLAAALAADIDESLFVGCQKNGTKDYPIALELSDKFNFKLNRSSPEINGKLVKNDVLAAWSTNSLAVYDQLYMPSHFRERTTPVFAVGGQGAETVKGNFRWRPLDQIDMPTATLQECQRSLTRIGVDPNHKWGSEWHYLVGRSGLHTGRAILSADYVARPVAQMPLVGLGRSERNELPAPGKDSPSAVFDCLVLLNRDLALQPFDALQKNQPATLVDERLRRLGGPLRLDEIPPFRIYGTPRPASGLLESHTQFASQVGYSGSFNGATIVPLIAPAVSSIDGIIPEPVKAALATLDASSVDRIPATSRPASAAGKLLAIATLF